MKEFVRDTDPNTIEECQKDPELIKAFLKKNSELTVENARLSRIAGGGWTPVTEWPIEEYEEVLALVTRSDSQDLTHRIAMWDPENDGWTVFGQKWGAEIVFVMPLPPAPTEDA